VRARALPASAALAAGGGGSGARTWPQADTLDTGPRGHEDHGVDELGNARPGATVEHPASGRHLSPTRPCDRRDGVEDEGAQARTPRSYAGAYLKGPYRWQVSYFTRGGKKEIGQVIIADGTGSVLEAWTGFQVA